MLCFSPIKTCPVECIAPPSDANHLSSAPPNQFPEEPSTATVKNRSFILNRPLPVTPSNHVSAKDLPPHLTQLLLPTLNSHTLAGTLFLNRTSNRFPLLLLNSLRTFRWEHAHKVLELILKSSCNPLPTKFKMDSSLMSGQWADHWLSPCTLHQNNRHPPSYPSHEELAQAIDRDHWAPNKTP